MVERELWKSQPELENFLWFFFLHVLLFLTNAAGSENGICSLVAPVVMGRALGCWGVGPGHWFLPGEQSQLGSLGGEQRPWIDKQGFPRPSGHPAIPLQRLLLTSVCVVETPSI